MTYNGGGAPFKTYEWQCICAFCGFVVQSPWTWTNCACSTPHVVCASCSQRERRDGGGCLTRCPLTLTDADRVLFTL